jgi:hypothetical protein
MVQRFLSSLLSFLRATLRRPLRTLTSGGRTRVEDVFMVVIAEEKMREAVETALRGGSFNPENAEQE